MFRFYSSYALLFSGLTHLLCCGVPIFLGTISVFTNVVFFDNELESFEFCAHSNALERIQRTASVCCLDWSELCIVALHRTSSIQILEAVKREATCSTFQVGGCQLCSSLEALYSGQCCFATCLW